MSNPKKGRELIGQVPALNVMKNAPLELFLADRSAILMKEPAASFAAVASLLAMEIMYFHNCPQYVPVDVVRSSVAGKHSVFGLVGSLLCSVSVWQAKLLDWATVT